ncbi:hypothetical protein RD792_016123 [Penstemon davidsonii]|uniref:Squalene monooxygenase n=1 Tax=Penstemon davidsonii TaxID=160366 RepID=A0ABR0CK72_9LAMI|nr:hypothetical protein RD792_016123 [Penstemon davidsonii]
MCRNSNAESHMDAKRGNDVIIVGAGVAGSALAYSLGKDGRKVQVIERNLNEPNRIVGELLQPAGYLKLLELGLDDCVRDIDAQMVHGYALYKDGKSVKLPYPLENYDADVTGQSFHHGRFVQKLRNKAASLPNVELVQGTATSLIEEKGTVKGIKYKTRGGQELTARAPLTVICDGCFSSFREFLAVPKINKLSHFVGIIAENCQLVYPNHAHVILGNPSIFAIYPISSTEVRFLIDIPAGLKLPSISNGQMAHFLKSVVALQVPKELYSAFIASIDKAQIKVMPVSCMPAKPCLTTRGALLLGDALNMRHAITGGGMTVALHDITIVSKLLKHVLNLYDTETVTKCTQHFYNIRKPMAFTMNVIADSLYKVAISSDDESREEIQKACFDYMSLGYSFSSGLVGLVSGLNPRPCSVAINICGVAIYVFGSILLPVPSPKRVYSAARVTLGAAAAVIPIILNEV